MASPDRDMVKYEIRRQQLKRRRRLVATFAGVVALAAALALMLPALSITGDRATPEAGFFPQPNAQQGQLLAGSPVATPNRTFTGELTGKDGAPTLIVTARVPEDALPEDVQMRVSPVTDNKVIQAAKGEAEASADIVAEEAKVLAADISFVDAQGNEVEPGQGVLVTFSVPEVSAISSPSSLAVVHVADDLQTEALAPSGVSLDIASEEVAFEASSFSVYAVVYTVDFHWEIDGQSFEFSLPGGGAMTLSQLVQVLGVAKGEGARAGDAAGATSAAASDAYQPTDDLMLNGVLVSEEAKQFVANIANVDFSSPELVSASKVEEATTVGALKQALGLQCEYSADLTESQIAEIDAQEVKAGDWALISLKPFLSEETLTITMKNGDVWTVAVTDAQAIADAEKATIDPSKSYLICYQVGNAYYLLKNDGTVDSSYHPNFNGDSDAAHDFEHVNSTYAWSFNHIFKEQDVEHHLDKNYYLIRPIDDKSKTLTLNEAGQALVQPSNNNVAVVQSGDGFILEGYHNVGTEEEHRYIHLGFENGAFVGVDGEGVVLRIYEMASLPTYDYTVRSADETRGTVSVSGGTAATEQHQGAADTHYFDATSNAEKKNAGTITATPVNHQDSGHRNKWLFDHWELDGLPLDRNQYPATIQAGALSIPHNDSRLVAYFRQNPEYVVPDNEKVPSSVEDMTGWLEELQNRNIPLDSSATKKTAEVYDYQNRIYRVDFTSKANFETFAGKLDMAFCLDVSNSMYFPSKLVQTTSANRANPMPIYQINNGNNKWWWLDTGRGWNNPYYLIADASGTATVFKIYFQDGYWKAQDSSRTIESEKSFVIGNEFRTNWTTDQFDDGTNKNHPFGAGDNDNTTYTIYDAGDGGNNRFVYLNQSLSGSSTDLNTISNLLAVAGDASPGVRIAYNTFNKELGNQRMDFQPASSGLTVDLAYSSGGGTRPDQAFMDAQNFSWSGAYTLDSDGNLATTDRYVILVTDGAPQGVRTYTDAAGKTHNIEPTTPQGIIQEVEAQAQALKDNSHVKLITVGLSMDSVTSGKRLLYDLADYDSKGNKMFYMAESGSDLQNIFRQITKVLMEDAVVLGDITDKVGEGFYLVNKATGLPLGPNATIDIEGNLTTDPSKVAGVVQGDGKTIKWTNQSIDSEAGWHGTVYVKAQEELLGGNGMNTNSGEATITATKYRVGGKDVAFDTTLPRDTLNLNAKLPSPKVNVNELTFFNSESEWTVYLGESVDPKQQLKALYDNLVVEEVVNGDGSLHYTIDPNTIEERWGTATGTAKTFSLPGLIERLIRKDSSLAAKYFSGDQLNWDVFLGDIMVGGVTLPYHEYGLTDGSNIKITLEKVITAGEEGDLVGKSPHATTVTGDDVEQYVLRIAYEPDYSVTPVGQGGQSTVDFRTGIYGTMYQGHATGREASTNTHKIDVFAKKLELLKADQEKKQITGSSATFVLYRKATDAEQADDSVTKVTPTGLTGGYVAVQTLITDGGTVKTDPLPLLANNEPYYLVETQAPNGFYLLTEPLKVSIDMTNHNTWTKLSDNTTSQDKPNPYVPSNWLQEATIKITDVNGNPSSSADYVMPTGQHEVIYDHANGTTDASVQYKIINSSGHELPSTGGIGTTVFTVVGLVLIAGAIVLLLRRRR